MKNLKVFLINDNYIWEWDHLKSIIGIPNLIYLSLLRNPIASQSGYRHYLANNIASLLALNNHFISD